MQILSRSALDLDRSRVGSLSQNVLSVIHAFHTDMCNTSVILHFIVCNLSFISHNFTFLYFEWVYYLITFCVFEFNTVLRFAEPLKSWSIWSVSAKVENHCGKKRNSRKDDFFVDLSKISKGLVSLSRKIVRAVWNRENELKAFFLFLKLTHNECLPLARENSTSPRQVLVFQTTCVSPAWNSRNVFIIITLNQIVLKFSELSFKRL